MEKRKITTFRHTAKSLAIIEDCMQKHDVSKSKAVNLLVEASSIANIKIAKKLQEKEENWYCDCQFGTYNQKQNLVHCACHWKSHSPNKGGWLPKDRMVTPEQCDRCNERSAKFLEQLDKQKEERKQFQKTRALRRSETHTF